MRIMVLLLLAAVSTGASEIERLSNEPASMLDIGLLRLDVFIGSTAVVVDGSPYGLRGVSGAGTTVEGDRLILLVIAPGEAEQADFIAYAKKLTGIVKKVGFVDKAFDHADHPFGSLNRAAIEAITFLRLRGDRYVYEVSLDDGTTRELPGPAFQTVPR